MHKKITIRPPTNYENFSPSELFRFFFQIGHWTEGSFSGELQSYTRGTLISTVTISKWKNRDVIPTRYSRPLFKMIETLSEPHIAKDWIRAFETVWALHAAGRRPVKGSPESSEYSNKIYAQHKKWIEQLYTQSTNAENLTASELYVPLQFFEPNGGQTEIYETEDVLRSLPNTWSCISGGPGSGKSMSALHMAASLCEGDTFPIYLRGSNISNIDIDTTNPDQLIIDAFSIKSFLKHFRASSFETACLILDGVDEINGGSPRLRQILSDLKAEQAACNAHHKTLNIIALGREAHINFVMAQIPPNQSRLLHLLSLDGAPRGNELSTPPPIQGTDLRALWWETYLTATEKNADPTLPDFLSLDYDDFSDFASDPLLSFLICRTAIHHAENDGISKMPHEDVNAFTFEANRNTVYKSIIERAALGMSHLLGPRQFFSVLQHIALAAWQTRDTQSVAVNMIDSALDTAELKSAFETLGFGPAASLPENILITSFYYRLAQSPEKPDNMVIEFSHKSFPEYLISTLIFDRFIALISAIETKGDTQAASKAWAFISHAGEHGPNLAGFCQKEAVLRFDELTHLNWDVALDIIQHHLGANHFNGTGLKSLSQLQQSNSLLFFIWSCLNLERQKRANAHFDLNDNNLNFDLSVLKRFQPPAAINLQPASFVETSSENQSFLTFALSGLKLTFADMTQLRFSLGHMEHAVFTDTSFAMTHWSHVKVTETKFTRSLFQQAIYHQWRVFCSDFINCLFQGTRFQGAFLRDCKMQDVFFSQCHFSEVEFMSLHFENVVFDRCVFSRSSFTRLHEKNGLSGIKFRHCTFMHMDDVIQIIPAENLMNTISTLPGETNIVSPKSLN